MRTRQPASVAAQKAMFSASACLLRLFDISLADDQNEIVLFSFHEGGRILKPRFGCTDVSAAASTNAKKVTFSASACFVCSKFESANDQQNQPKFSRTYAVVARVLFKLAEPMLFARVLFRLAEPMQLWQGFCSSYPNKLSERMLLWQELGLYDASYFLETLQESKEFQT